MVTVVKPMDQKPRAVVIYARTGGGHQSAARAIGETLNRLALVSDVKIIDFVREYNPPVWRHLPMAYSIAQRTGILWRTWYGSANGVRRARATNNIIGHLTIDAFSRMFSDHPADIYISTHSALNHGMAYAWQRTAPAGSTKPLLCTVVTDLITTPPIWFSPSIDAYVVLTGQAYLSARRAGIRHDRLHLCPFPVPDRFFETSPDARTALRQQLDIDHNRNVILIAGGYDGSGPIFETVRQLSKASEDFTVLVVAGTNSRLLSRLRRTTWPMNVVALGSVTDLNPLLQAADIFITKAGPASLHEAAAQGVPMVIFHELAGQEAGNAQIMTEAGAAVRATTPAVAAREAARILRSAAVRQVMTSAATQLVDRRGTEQICRTLLSLAVRRPPAVAE